MKRFLASALVIARRDFAAILFSRSFFFFLLGPLFPVAIGAMAGGIGANVGQSVEPPSLGVAMSAADTAAIMRARSELVPAARMPDLAVIATPEGDAAVDARRLLAEQSGATRVVAILSGSLDQPKLTGPAAPLDGWRGSTSLLVDKARTADGALPAIALDKIAAAPRTDTKGRLQTAWASQVLLFLLTMFLGTMVLSNLVEEKANKIIEVLAAAVPMDAVFFGKLIAMLGISFVGLSVWGGVAGVAVLAGAGEMPFLTAPAVGWPMFALFGVIYFSAAYLLLGSVFLIIGGLAATVREVQTLSMPVTMAQVVVFFFASYALGSMGEPIEIAATVIPFTSPFAMLARAAIQPDLSIHLLAIAWQALWVAIIIHLGARIFRRTVMKSGPAQKKGWLARRKAA